MFSDLKEQKTVSDRLQRCLKNGRLAHAYLFAGPAGSGRQLAARTLAKALNCLHKTGDSCDNCDSCRRIDGGSHPDMHWVRPESKSRRILIDQIREFERAVNLKPAVARVKVGVVVDADCMGDEAGNAFLKTLEEPPAQTVILLLTASPEQLLPTILSRCLRINFGRLAAEAEPPFRKTLLPLLLEHSAPQTSPVFRAYRLHAAITGILRQTRDAISQQIQTETNLDRYEELDPKVRERLEKEMEARITGQYRGALAQLLEELQSWWADLLLCAAGADDAKLVHRDHAAQLRRAVAGLSFADAAHNLDAIEQIGNHISRNIPETLAFEVGLLKLRAAGAKHS